ncbi:MAG: hypothetical protein ACEQSF_05145 [Solirubrobacteraceae bacterium]
MRTKLTIIILTPLLIFASCTKKEEGNNQEDNKISVTKRILSKLKLIDLDETIIQKQKIKEIYDLLKLVEFNKKSIDTIAKNEVFKIFNNDSLTKQFITDEVRFINEGFRLDQVKVNKDTILVFLRKEENVLERKFLYQLVKDSIIDKNLPPTVFFKIKTAEYFNGEKDSIVTIK